MKNLKKVVTDDRNINQLQDNVEQAITPIITSEIINGLIIKDIEVLTGTTKTIPHKLGRAPNGYAIIKRNANSQVWNGVINKKNIELNSSANVTISLWVF